MYGWNAAQPDLEFDKIDKIGRIHKINTLKPIERKQFKRPESQ